MRKIFEDFFDNIETDELKPESVEDDLHKYSYDYTFSVIIPVIDVENNPMKILKKIEYIIGNINFERVSDIDIHELYAGTKLYEYCFSFNFSGLINYKELYMLMNGLKNLYTTYGLRMHIGLKKYSVAEDDLGDRENYLIMKQYHSYIKDLYNMLYAKFAHYMLKPYQLVKLIKLLRKQSVIFYEVNTNTKNAKHYHFVKDAVLPKDTFNSQEFQDALDKLPMMVMPCTEIINNDDDKCMIFHNNENDVKQCFRDIKEHFMSNDMACDIYYDDVYNTVIFSVQKPFRAPGITDKTIEIDYVVNYVLNFGKVVSTKPESYDYFVYILKLFKAVNMPDAIVKKVIYISNRKLNNQLKDVYKTL